MDVQRDLYQPRECRKDMRSLTTAQSNVAYIKPANLTAAIRQSGLTRDAIAGEMKVTVEMLVAWEQVNEDSRPTFDQAAKLCDVLGIPLGMLFLSEPAHRPLMIPDRRSLAPPRPLSPNFRRLISDVMVRRDWYRQHAIESGASPLPFVGSVSTSDDIIEVATLIRRTLGLTPEDRRGVYDWSAYLGRFASRAEDAGILVMRSAFVGNTGRRIERAEVQGFAIADPVAPVVFVNTSDFVTAQVFTLAHELAHIWLGQSAISISDQGDAARDAIETRCNAIATELLVPQRDFVVGWRQTEPSDRLPVLVRRYWVSARVILRRARELGLISFDEYHALRDDAISLEQKRRKGRGTYYGNATTRAGHRFTNAVVSEVNRGSIAIPEGASLLAMSINTFARFADAGH